MSDPAGDLKQATAHWVARDTIAWNIAGGAAHTYTLHHAASGGLMLESAGVQGGSALTLDYDPNGLSDAVKARFPHLTGYAALKIRAADRAKVPDILKGQIAVAAVDSAGKLIAATALQIPGVLDDLYTYDGPLGVVYGSRKRLGVYLWAPTARSVTLHVFASSDARNSTPHRMINDPQTGVWSSAGRAAWYGAYYLFEVEVFVRSTGRIERNLVTDPYSTSLSTNSLRSQFISLDDPRYMPAGWQQVRKPPLEAPEDMVLYELHVRDFSIYDQLVPVNERGTFKAFAARNSNGMQHLRALAQAGLTHIHLLPVFDIATINENRAERNEPDSAVLASFPPDSLEQQAYVQQFRATDGFNWGYDPFHYTVPEGSYATDPHGPTRIHEFRAMVQALNESGLRVVMDVVYNHTYASGQDSKSVLDKIVPGYYHRLNPLGDVETSTCCPNTATEHTMMEKLMLDSVLTWARHYKVDGFRFDLMGHHMKRNMEKLRAALDGLTIAQDGVDGKQIYVYGEGWNFGEVSNNQRGVNATQFNMADTGIGAFNDRLRDAVRGGGAFDSGHGLKNQGFINGLFYEPNDLPQDGVEAQRTRLLRYGDWIRVGVAGNMATYSFEDRDGAQVTGAQVDYNGSPTGYTLDPQEVITYVEAHDNQTLFDTIQYKAPIATSMADRVRIQNLGNAIVMLGQGIPFFHAGQDMLRSKSLDRNSYNSGDWFNRLDFTYETNNWGVGVPPIENQADVPIMQALLGNPALKPTRPDIVTAVHYFRDLLAIRKSSPLFRLRTGSDVQQRVTMHNTGPTQIPGLLVMSISDQVTPDLDPQHELIVVLHNARTETTVFTEPAMAGLRLRLHPVQANGSDPLVKTATFNTATGAWTIPPRTTAVFVLPQE